MQPSSDVSIARCPGAADAECAGAQFLPFLAPGLSLLPPRLADRIVRLFVNLRENDCPKRIAREAGMHRRTMDRWIARSGIGPMRHLVVTAQILHAYTLLRTTDVEPRDAIERAGYRSQEALDRQCRSRLGVSLNNAAKTYPPRRLVKELAQAAKLKS
jgi:AraC-like DNA-binding protein